MHPLFVYCGHEELLLQLVLSVIQQGLSLPDVDPILIQQGLSGVYLGLPLVQQRLSTLYVDLSLK